MNELCIIGVGQLQLSFQWIRQPHNFQGYISGMVEISIEGRPSICERDFGKKRFELSKAGKLSFSSLFANGEVNKMSG